MNRTSKAPVTEESHSSRYKALFHIPYLLCGVLIKNQSTFNRKLVSFTANYIHVNVSHHDWFPCWTLWNQQIAPALRTWAKFSVIWAPSPVNFTIELRQWGTRCCLMLLSTYPCGRRSPAFWVLGTRRGTVAFASGCARNHMAVSVRCLSNFPIHRRRGVLSVAAKPLWGAPWLIYRELSYLLLHLCLS